MSEEQASSAWLLSMLGDPNLRFPERPQLVDDLFVFEMPEGLGFQFRGAAAPTILRGRHAAAAVQALRPVLDGRHSLNEILEHRPLDLPVSAILKALVALHSKGLLRGKGPARPEERDPTLDRQALFWGRNLGVTFRNGSADEVQLRLERARVALLGTGLLAATALDLLTRAGVLRPRLVTWDDDGTLARAVRGVIDPRDLVELPTTEPGPAVDALKGEEGMPDLIVTATSQAPNTLFRAINRLSMESRTPWLRANLDGGTLELGPFIRPGTSACFSCMQIRQASALGTPIEEILYQSELERPRAAGATPPIGEAVPFAVLAAGLIVCEVVRIVTGMARPTLLDSVQSIALLEGGWRTHRLLPVPTCPDCRLAGRAEP